MLSPVTLSVKKMQPLPVRFAAASPPPEDAETVAMRTQMLSTLSPLLPQALETLKYSLNNASTYSSSAIAAQAVVQTLATLLGPVKK